LKKCPECGNNSPVHSGFCVACGTSLELAANTRRERFLFFLTPLFLSILGIAVCAEFSIKQPLESGLSLGGTFAFIYLGAGLAFWIFARLFGLPSAADSYWHAGMFTLIHLIACIFLTYNLEVLIFDINNPGMGILDYGKARFSVLIAIYLPTLLVGVLAISARAKSSCRVDLAPGRKFVLTQGFWLISAAAVLLGILIQLFLPGEVGRLIKARMYYEADAAELAIKTAEAGLAEREDFAPLHYLKGSAILDSAPGGYTPAQALYHLQRAVVLVPNNALYHYKISQAHEIEHNVDEAIQSASAAVSLQPGDSFLWLHLGEIYLKYRRLNDAIAAYRSALKLEPANATLLNNLAFTCLEANVDLPQALEMARRSVELLPDFVFNTDTLAWALYKNGRYTEALDVIGPIYADRPEMTPEVDFHYAMILHANKLLTEPVKALEKLLARPEVASDLPFQKQINEAKMKILLESVPENTKEVVQQK